MMDVCWRDNILGGMANLLISMDGPEKYVRFRRMHWRWRGITAGGVFVRRDIGKNWIFVRERCGVNV